MRVVVFGDVMLDTWISVAPVKVSEEAPVLIADYQYTTYSPGGAANAAVNCAHLGAETALVGFVGDVQSLRVQRLIHALDKQGVNFQDLIFSPEWKIIEKCRFVDELGRHLLRVDYDNAFYPEQNHIATLSDALLHRDYDVLLISDYGRGTCVESVVRNAIVARTHFVVVNGRPENMAIYTGADVLVLNQHEAEQAVGRVMATEDLAFEVHAWYGGFGYAPKNVVVTVGDKGLYWYDRRKTIHVPAPRVAVADVCGAGDTVTASIAVSGKINKHVLEWAVENAARVVSQRGTSVPGEKI